MADNVDIRVSPSLHPDNVTALDGYSESVSHLVAETATALSEAYLGVGQVHSARDLARKNPTWNESQQLVMTADLADKVQQRIEKRIFHARATLEKGLAILEKELTAPVTATASHSMASEIRAFAAKLDASGRMALIRKAIHEGDELVAGSILGGPAFLSGLEDETLKTFTRMWRERINPEASQRVKVMAAANDLLANRHKLIAGELEKAVGAAPSKIARLRSAKSKAEEAFVLRDA